MKTRFIALAIIAALVSASPSIAQTVPIIAQSTQITAPDQSQVRLPIYTVTQSGVSEESAKILAEALGLRANPINKNGLLRYMDPQLFQNIPTKKVDIKIQEAADEDGQETVAEAFDFDALKNIKVLDEKTALERAEEALRKAGLSVLGGTPSVANSTFEALTVKGEKVASTVIDTQVNYNLRLGNYKLIGPGAKVKIAFNGEGAVTQLVYAQRSLTEGKAVPIISQTEANKLATAIYQQQGQKGKLQLSSELVYYGPSLEFTSVKQILPHYLYTAVLATNSQQIPLRQILIPAVANSVAKLTLSASSKGSRVIAKANVSGGNAPYTFIWSSSSTTLNPELAQRGESIEYSVEKREKNQNTPEVVSVRVTDANGLTVQASQTVEVKQAAVFPSSASFNALKSLGRVDVGIEWIGTSQGLGGSAGNAAGFVNRFQSAGIPVEFNYGDYSAWERDFKDSGLGGDDDNYADNVDLVFYTGHANGNGFTFSSNRDDGFLHYSEARWGQKDLEWMAIAACGPMQATEGGLSLVQRWGPAFQGLHILMGYANVSYDNTQEGGLFANYMLRNPFLWWNRPMKVREAWAQMATDVQPSSVTYGIMGVFGNGGVTSYNDYFWGKGNVSPDLRGSNIQGFWIVRAPS